ncbi:hypothetical protein [Arthrobacter caoxuetaonis]|uniref:Uncharacterized protein n=1 Tax=Arthrobacter caoxuetaonis TaxID=2886935 RepID=A0A9X1MGE5_9MICC|nr:hypothetical protein [Arthrobacter caoxuetaonis]MCC3299346.1 hypothetical protein [Arthrobacter caoxuetaonis]USQ59161.1 hypothetical protein NF551_18820 [Arthrobacter caoxuetaonis]
MSGLNPFGQAILRIEAERMEQARAAVGAGWTPEHHPGLCCPGPEASQPRRPTPNPGYAAVRRRAAEARVLSLASRLARLPEPGEGSGTGHGEINIPFSRRENATAAAVARAAEITDLRARLRHARDRAAYWAEREKYAAGLLREETRDRPHT